MNWTILASVLGTALIFAGAWIKIAQTGHREGCMKRFLTIEKDAQALKGEVVGNEKTIGEKFSSINNRLERIEDEMKDMRVTIEKIWMNMNKRKVNHGE